MEIVSRTLSMKNIVFLHDRNVCLSLDLWQLCIICAHPKHKYLVYLSSKVLLTVFILFLSSHFGGPLFLHVLSVPVYNSTTSGSNSSLLKRCRPTYFHSCDSQSSLGPSIA